jgi:tetratricopeptide (TPR) repeat protein
MKWFNTLVIKKFTERLSKPVSNDGSLHLEKGRQFYLSNRFQDALLHLNCAINSGFDQGVYALRGTCLQKLDYHYNAIEDFDKAIETDPLEFSIYYNRAVSKRAILDFTGHIEDLHNAIYYYKKHSTIENQVLREFEAHLQAAKMDIEGPIQNRHEIRKAPSLEIKSLIRDSLNLIKKAKGRNVTVN